MAVRKSWSREEVTIALGLYAVTPASKISGKNKAIQELAKLLGRSPGSVSYKLSNLLELDKHRKGGPKGFGNYSKTDEEIMKKFSAEGDPGNLKLDLLHDALAGLCDENYSSFYIPQNLRLLRDSLIIEEPRTGNEVLRLIRTRTNQSYFRSSVLANCGEKCAITECNIPSLLEAAHILPWTAFVEARMEISNGIPLIPLFHKAYDQNLIGITADGVIKVSKKLLLSGDKTFGSFMSELENKKLHMESYRTPINRDYLSQRYKEFSDHI